MDDLLLRILAVAAVIAVAVSVGYLFRRTAVFHPAVDVSGLGLPPGLIVFSSTNCIRCKEVLASVMSLDVPLREVTYELEPHLHERAGVVGVPLTLAIDQAGNLVDQVAGAASSRVLRRAAVRAGFRP